MSPHDVLSPELSVLLDAAIQEHPGPWPCEVPDYWEKMKYVEWLLETHSFRSAPDGKHVELPCLVHHGQFAAIFRNERWALREGPMFPPSMLECLDIQARFRGVNGSLQSLLRKLGLV